MSDKPHIAIVGAGISGLTAAWLLAPTARVSLYEAADYIGGHSNTVDITLKGRQFAVDTGFLVHNNVTYPNLIQLFKALNINTYPSEMTFSVRHDAAKLEWAGSSLLTLFGQLKNLFRPAFWRMIQDILKLNRDAPRLLEQVRGSTLTLGELLAQEGYSRELMEWYLLPMGAAIWSSPMEDMTAFPAETFLQFCLNHGLLQVSNRPQWRSIEGCSRAYVAAMVADIRKLGSEVFAGTSVASILRHEDRVDLTLGNGQSVRADYVVMATHTDQSLAMLSDASAEETRVLSAVKYQANTAYLHGDTQLMPKRKRLWSAWNYLRQSADPKVPVAVTYWLNKLQNIGTNEPIFVTLNPEQPPEQTKTWQVIEYAHPLLDTAAYEAQQRLPSLQGQRRTYFAGAWTRYGFHEDGHRSGIAVAKLLGATVPWSEVL